jgi:hypothetical protein
MKTNGMPSPTTPSGLLRFSSLVNGADRRVRRLDVAEEDHEEDSSPARSAQCRQE